LIAVDPPELEKDSDSHPSRGLDFKQIQSVINFDLPFITDHVANSDSETEERIISGYIHRIGRTGRTNDGMALSFFCKATDSGHGWSPEKMAEKTGCNIQPFQIQMDKVEGFRYRVMDIWKSVTKGAIREAQLKDIKAELLASERLKGHFASHPKDMEMLGGAKSKEQVENYEGEEISEFEKKARKKCFPVAKNVPVYCLMRNSRSNAGNMEAIQLRKDGLLGPFHQALRKKKSFKRRRENK
jgi:superfamily II DNA/RNA helicase